MSAKDDDDDDRNNDDAGHGHGRGPYDDNDFPNDAFDGGVDDGFFDNDDPFVEEEGNNDLWEEVVDDDDDDDDDDDKGEELVEEEEVVLEEVEEEELLEEEEIVEEEEEEEEELVDVEEKNNQTTSNNSNLDDQRNSLHSLGMWSVDNSASVDFDLGSYAEMSSHASDNFVPDDYEDACRKLLEIIQPNIDPDDMIRRCDHKTLYANLREQYRHLVHKHPELAASSAAAGDAGAGPATASAGNIGDENGGGDGGGGGSGGFWGSEGGSANNEVDENDNAFFSGGPFHATSTAASAGDDENMNMNDQWPEDGGFDDDDDGDHGNSNNNAVEDPFESAGDSNIQSDEAARGTNAANATSISFDSNDTEVEVEKWLERNADDPDDYDYACRKLIKVIYGPDSPDHDPDTMMRRTSAPDLYRYLKNEYWFKIHTGELKEGMDHSSHHVSSNNNNNTNQGSSNQDSVASFEESPRRLKGIVEADVSSDAALFSEENDTNQGKNDEEVDTKQSHPDKVEVVGKDERSIEQSMDSLPPPAEEEAEAKHNEVTDSVFPENNDAVLDKSSVVEATNNDINGDSTDDVPVLVKEEADDVIEVTAEDVSDETEDEAVHQAETQTDNPIMTESVPQDPETALLYELQRLKEEEARLLEEEEKLREEAMRIQTSQGEMQNSLPDSVDEIEGTVMQVQLVDERTEDLHRSGLLIREMSSESIIETSEEESDEDNPTNMGETDQLAASDDNSASSGQSDRVDNTENVAAVTESPDDGDTEAELLRQERFERYTREYNDILDSQDRGEDIDEDRLYLLELAVRKRLDEELTEDEMAELEDFDAAEVAYDSTPRSNSSNYPDEGDEEENNETVSTLREEAIDDKRSHDENSTTGEGATTDGEKGDVANLIDENLKETKEGVEERVWRKRKIEADLTELVQQAEEEELGELVTTDAMVALKMAASRIALSKKYFDDGKNDYVYFPSVAKCIYDFSLIEEAEKYYLDGSDDFPMELSTALCTIASSRLNGDVQEVDENDEDIMEEAVDVILDFGDADESVETMLRKTMIDEELSTLVLDAEQQELDSDFSPSLVSILKAAAFKVAYTRKYRDGDKFIYFPSVAKTVYSFALMDQAEEIIQDSDMEEIPTEYVNALCTVAASYLTGNTNEVDPEDEFVKKTSVDVDMPNDFIRAVDNGEPSSRHDERHDGSNGNLSNSVTSDVEKSSKSVTLEMSRDLAMQESQDIAEATDRDDAGERNDDSTPSELQERDQMLSDDFARLIEETEENEIDGKLDEEMVNALKDAAGKICYVKKFFDVTTDSFVYYPSVAKSIIDYKLFEASGNDSLDFPPDQVSSIRAVAATLVKNSEPDESDDYVFNMTVDVDLHQSAEADEEDVPPANENPSPSDEDSTAVNEASSHTEENANTASPATEDAPQREVTESIRCAQMVTNELDQLIRATEEEEDLEEPFDPESIDALRVAAHKIAYRKKFYSVLEDEIIYYPSVARTIVDYSLFDAATEAYGDEEDEFPGDLTAALRAVGMSRMMDDDLDYDYMDSIATPIEDGEDRASLNEESPPHLKPSEDTEKDTSASDSPITTPDPHDQSTALDTEDPVGTIPTPDVIPEDDSGLESPIGTERTLPDNRQDSSPVEPPTEPSETKVPADDSSDAIQASISPVVVSKDHSSESSKPKMNPDEIEAEEQRLNEMAEILEFKRRQDKQKISDDAKALEELKSSVSRDAVDRTNALEEDIRQKEQQLDEEYALLFEKWQVDSQKVDKALADLISRNNSELVRIDAEIKTVQTELASEKERIENGLRDIEQQRHDDEESLPQKHQALRAKQATARTTLEALKKSIEGEMKETDQQETDPKEEKGRSFFGFGSSKKKQQLEHEKLKQAKLMELRIKEMELEKEIDEMVSEESRLKDQAKTRERQRLELQSQLKKDSEELEVSSRSAAEKLTALADEQKQLETDFSEQERNLISQNQTLQETRKEDEAWVAAEKVKLAELFEQGQNEIADWANVQQEKQLKEEERLSNTAMALKEKWVKEEEAFEKDVDFLEQTKAELGISSDPRTLNHEEQDSTQDGTNPYHGSSSSQTGDVSNNMSLPSREEHIITDESTPDHLVGLHQPIDESNDSCSVKSHELFDPPTRASALTKPLLAAALKAKEQQIEMSKSLSQLQIFDPDQPQERKKGAVDLSASVPDHLIAMNQPKSHQYERNSIRELELFDVPEEREFEQKPLLAAALRAKQQSQLGVSLSGLDMLKENRTEESKNDFSKSVPINMTSDQVVDTNRPANDQSLRVEESDSQITSENPFPTTAPEAEDDQEEQNEESTRNDEKEPSPKKTHIPKTGHDMSALFHEAKSVSLTKTQEDSIPSAAEIGADTDDDVHPLTGDTSIDENTSPVEVSQLHEDEDSSGPQRMAWWQKNGKDLVATQFDSSRQHEKTKLEESLVEHNRSIAESRTKPSDCIETKTTAVTGSSQDISTPAKSSVSSVPSSLEEKRRKAAEARVRALAIRTGGIHSSPGSSKTDVLLSPKDKFKQTQQQLQQRVDASKIVISPASPSGNARALEWQVAANQKPQLDIEDGSSNGVKSSRPSDHLAWWRKNGKRLVAEKLGRKVAPSPSVDGKQDFREAEVRRIAERTQLVRESRLAQEAGEPQIARSLSGATSDPSATLLMPTINDGPREKSHPTLLYPMIRETNRLSGFIRRYENKLENVCRSLLSVASETNNDQGAVTAKDLPLPEMVDYIQNADWFKAQSSSTGSNGQNFQPQLMFSRRDSIQRQESKKAFLTEMSKEPEKMSESKSYKVTAVGHAFLQMDGPVQADVGRFLAHLVRSSSASESDGSGNGLTQADMKTRWSDIAQLSGDIQSQRIYDNLDDLISFCLDAHMIQ